MVFREVPGVFKCSQTSYVNIKNLEILNQAQENYLNIKTEILKVTSNFSNNLDSALDSIKTTEDEIKENMQKAENAEKVLQETLK